MALPPSQFPSFVEIVLMTDLSFRLSLTHPLAHSPGVLSTFQQQHQMAHKTRLIFSILPSSQFFSFIAFALCEAREEKRLGDDAESF